MVALQTLVQQCNDLLQPEKFQDYCPNGLQVSGTSEIKRIVSGVTANLALIEAAIDLKADVLLVHHGLFWKGDTQTVTGIRQKRLKQLLTANVNVIAYHLPLDAHPTLGNNVQLALQLGLTIDSWFLKDFGPPCGCVGHLAQPLSCEELAYLLETKLHHKPIHVNARQKPIRTLAWCTGAAQKYIEIAASLSVDAYLTGEISESTQSLAQESSIDFFAAGHHATERYGVQALGQHLAEHFQLEHQFVDVPNVA